MRFWIPRIIRKSICVSFRNALHTKLMDFIESDLKLKSPTNVKTSKALYIVHFPLHMWKIDRIHVVLSTFKFLWEVLRNTLYQLSFFDGCGLPRIFSSWNMQTYIARTTLYIFTPAHGVLLICYEMQAQVVTIVCFSNLHISGKTWLKFAVSSMYRKNYCYQRWFYII